MGGEDAGDVNSSKALDQGGELEAAAERLEEEAAERKRRQVLLLLAALGSLQGYRGRAKAVLDRLEHEGRARENALFEQLRESIAQL